jgi:hypothetical protein
MKLEKRKNVQAAHAQLVMQMAKRCLRELSKKEYELNVSYAEMQRRLSKVIVNQSGKASYGCSAYISIDVGCYAGGMTWFSEYATIADDPTIGARTFDTPEQALFALVAHEIAHHVQYCYGPYTRWLKRKFRKPHGEGWQAIYRILRRELVNSAA